MTRRMAQPDRRGPETGRPRAGPSAARARRRRTFDRQPPQDLTAEQSVLGGMLLSKDAIADVVEVLRPDDFYRPAHQTVYDCILDLYGRGEPADAVTVSAELQRRGELHPARRRAVPAHADRHRAHRGQRRLLRRDRRREGDPAPPGRGRHPHRAARLRTAAEGAEVNDVVDRAQAAIYEVTERRTSEDYVAARGAAAAHDGRDRRHRLPRRRRAGRAHRLRRPRRGHQRPAPRPDDHRGGPARSGQVHARAWTSPARARSSTASPARCSRWR